MRSEILLGLPLYEISASEQVGGAVKIRARYVGSRQCPHCGSGQLRNKGKYLREVRHQNWGFRPVLLYLEARKWRCLDHRDGINRSCLGRREGIGARPCSGTSGTDSNASLENGTRRCPQVLGIDEHFF